MKKRCQKPAIHRFNVLRALLAFKMATNNSEKQKQKVKSGYEKRKEKRQRNLKESSTAQGQTYLTNFFTPKITAPASDATAMIEDTEHEVLHYDGVNENTTEIAVELNQFNETTSTAVAGISVPVANSPSVQNSDEFYKGKKINLDWLLQAHHCLSVLKEKYGNRLRPYEERCTKRLCDWMSMKKAGLVCLIIIHGHGL